MSTRVEQLAAQFEAVNDEIIAMVAECTDEQWRQPCADDERSVAVVAHHVADVNGAFAGIVANLAAGETHSPTVSMEVIHQVNAEHAREHAAVGKAEVLQGLRGNGAAVAQQLRSLREEQLDRAAGIYGGNELNVAQVVEWVIIGHPREHLESIRATLAH